MSDERVNYRPEIDGLRALAVLSVFIFHLNHSWLPGGFVGVDIFFVISGYLISSIIYAECQKEKFSFLKFYQRRIARILPLFSVVALATIICASFIYTAQDFAATGAMLVATALSVANMKLMLQGNYFEISPDSQPFLHYWSLSVEEQFYILYPIMLFLLMRHARRAVIYIILIVAIASFALSVWLTNHKPVWAFYLLPTRAWELLLGCIISVLPRIAVQKGVEPLNALLPIVGAAVIFSSFVVINDNNTFPGWIAAVPVGGAAAIIVSTNSSANVIIRMLSTQIFVFIGKISFSLYLWHWPLFCVIDYLFLEQAEQHRIALKIVSSFAVSILTHYTLEKPARRCLNIRSNRRASYVALATFLAISIPLGMHVRNTHYIDATESDVRHGGLIFKTNPNAPTVILMGDSNGSMYGTVVRDICAELNYNLVVLSVSAGDQLPSTKNQQSQLWADAFDAVRRVQPEYIIVGHAWAEKLRSDPKRLDLAIQLLTPYAKRIVLLTQPPVLPKTANRLAIRQGIRPPFFEDEANSRKRRDVNQEMKTRADRNVTIVDVASQFEAEDGSVRFMDEKGNQLYQDAHHLSGFGAEQIHNILKTALMPNYERVP